MPDFTWPEELVTVAWSQLGRDILKSWTGLLAADTGMRVRYDGSLDTVFDLAVTGNTKAAQILSGERRSEKRGAAPFPMRLVWPQSRTNSGYFVRGDSKIKTIYDIKPGCRVVDMRGYVASQKILDGLLAWAGIGDIEKDIDWVPASDATHKTKLVVDGEADLAFGVPSSPSMHRAEQNPHGIRWLDCNWEKDPEGARRFLEVDPLLGFGPMRGGVASCQGVWGTSGSSLYCANAATGADLIYHLTRWLDENYPRFKDAHPWNLTCTREILQDELKHTFIPLHEGTIRYLRELGEWTEQLERRQRRNLDLLDRYLEVDREALALAAQKDITVADDSPDWRELLSQQHREAGLPDFRVFLSPEDD